MKIDFKKELKHLYKPSEKEVVVVNVPSMNFIMIDGIGNPNISQEYKEAVETLYAVSYALKFMIKKGETAIDYGVMPLEGLWWVDDMTKFSMENKDVWKWTSIIMQPKYVTIDLFEQAVEQVKKKKNPPVISKLRFESFSEGLSVQIMHIGPFSAEGPTIEKIHIFAKENDYELRGKHHEIYLNDPRKISPEKMKTIIRQPIQKR